ncbi:uncharacterized protein LOC123556896 [Mercenaria mercenaria]|uniref:uncharacterized protein LOC123556896 n=1 Tax=Mercenaria mercenaria TaxID=6596 RepID=UPI00234F9406|nr:uncharacterized protein LOC123556896 [Mercenaria mercenaria]
MVTQENEYYIRLILLMLRAGTLVLRQTLFKELEDRDIQLNSFLQINKDAVKQLKESKVLTLKQYNILFPDNDTMPDICKFDISLLSCLLLNLFVPSLHRSDEKAIENIRTLRNDFIAHHPNGCIDGRTFSNKSNQLRTSILNLGKRLSSEEYSSLAEMIKSVNDDPIDIKCALQDFKLDAAGTCEQFIEHVSQQIEHLSLTVEQLRNNQQDIQQVVIDLQNIIQNGNKNISTVIVGEVTVSGRNPEAVTEAAATLIAHAKRSKGFIKRFSSALESSRQGMANKISTVFTRVKGFFSSRNPDEQSASQRSVALLLEDIQNARGEVIDVSEGSVLLHIRCHSVVVLLSVLNYFKSTVLEQRLKDIEECLTEETGSKINLSACIQIKPLQEAVQNIMENQSQMFTKLVRFSVKCRDAEGVLNVFNLFEGSKMSDNVSTLSNSLSSEVGEPVTLKTSVDSYSIQEYIRGARDNASEQIETEQSVTRLISEKKEGASGALQNVSIEETDQPFVTEDPSTPTVSGLSWLAQKDTFRSLRDRSYYDGIKLLQKGENQYEFVAFLLYSDTDENVSSFVIDRLNTHLHLLTGIQRDLICTEDKHFRIGYFILGEYIQCMERSAMVVVIVSDLADTSHYAVLKDADACGKQIVPIILEGGDINASFFKGFANLSKVKLRLKKEYDGYTPEPEWTEFCSSIIRLIPNSGVKVMSYKRQHRIKDDTLSKFGPMITKLQREVVHHQKMSPIDSEDDTLRTLGPIITKLQREVVDHQQITPIDF